MRSRLIGLLFACALVCLMCLPFIVSSESTQTTEIPVPPRAACEAVFVSPSFPAPALMQQTARVHGSAPETPESCRVVAPPVTDANGVPILRVSYVRSNYQAFCLTGNGG